jgi:hypothetical protein
MKITLFKRQQYQFQLRLRYPFFNGSETTTGIVNVVIPARNLLSARAKLAKHVKRNLQIQILSTITAQSQAALYGVATTRTNSPYSIGGVDESKPFPKEAKVYYSRWFPLYFRGIMIPYFGIIIRSKYRGNFELIEHEQIHWRQFRRMGALVFLVRYFLQLVFIGYDTMPMEMEARQHEDEYVRG